eukprot:Rhum_TRINITY_DN14996_c0_g1::Rhum_TRINITY_DN14996_c0_g1_i1::g.132234::m.132234
MTELTWDQRRRSEQSPFFACLVEWRDVSAPALTDEELAKWLHKYVGYEEDLYIGLAYRHGARPKWPDSVPNKQKRLAPDNLQAPKRTQEALLLDGSPPPPAASAAPPSAAAAAAATTSPPQQPAPKSHSNPPPSAQQQQQQQRSRARRHSAGSSAAAAAQQRRRSKSIHRRLDYQGIPREMHEFRSERDWLNAPHESTQLRDPAGNVLPRKTPVKLARRACDEPDAAFVCAYCPACGSCLDLLLSPDAVHCDRILDQLDAAYAHVAKLEAALEGCSPTKTTWTHYVKPVPEHNELYPPPPPSAEHSGGAAAAAAAASSSSPFAASVASTAAGASGAGAATSMAAAALLRSAASAVDASLKAAASASTTSKRARSSVDSTSSRSSISCPSMRISIWVRSLLHAPLSPLRRLCSSRSTSSLAGFSSSTTPATPCCRFKSRATWSFASCSCFFSASFSSGVGGALGLNVFTSRLRSLNWTRRSLSKAESSRRRPPGWSTSVIVSQ